jgi:predicted RNase H-like HicB family nuclease
MPAQAAGGVLGGEVAGLTRGEMSTHYIAVLVPEKGGGWSVLFPDLPGCATQGESVHEAIEMATEAASAHLDVMRERGDASPAPSDLAAVKANENWRAEYEVDWSTAVVSLVEVGRL